MFPLCMTEARWKGSNAMRRLYPIAARVAQNLFLTSDTPVPTSNSPGWQNHLEIAPYIEGNTQIMGSLVGG